MATAKPNKKIHVDKLESALSKLDNLEQKPKSELSLRESVYFLRDKLRSAVKKGYSYEDLSELLQQQEVIISAATLKQYLTEFSRESRKKRTAKSNLVKQSESVESSQQTVPKQSSAELQRDLGVEQLDASSDLAPMQIENTQQVSKRETDDTATESEEKSQHLSRKPTKRRVLAKSTEDLSEEFNKY